MFFILKIFFIIITVIIFVAYLCPILLLPKIIFYILFQNYEKDLKKLLKHLNISWILLYIDGVLWFPVVFLTTLFTNRWGYQLQERVIYSLMFEPILPIACILILYIYRIKIRKKI